jgi:hypothetical protein
MRINVPTELTGLEEAINGVFSEMAGVNSDSDEYKKMVDQLAKLYKMKETEDNFLLKKIEAESAEMENYSKVKLAELEMDLKTKEFEKSRRVSPDTLAIVAANIAGILLIIGYERANVVTSKALSFILKTK